MDQKIRDHVAQYNRAKGWPAETDEDIIETIVEANTIHDEVVQSRRWWNETFCVVEIDGMLIGYDGAETTGDDSPLDKGWEFDPNSITLVERKTETVEVTRYIAVEASNGQ